MRRLLFVANGLYGGGAEKILQTIISNLDRTKYDITLYSLHPAELDKDLYKGDLTYKSIFSGNKFVRKVKSWIFNNCSPQMFYKLFIHDKYDTEIAFIEGESTKIISGSSNPRSFKLAWVHVDLLQNPWTSFLYQDQREESLLYDKFDQILCVSESVRIATIEKFALPPHKVHTQYNPIDRNEILQKSHEPCDLSASSNIRLIAVGRLVAQKGFDRLLRVIKKLNNDNFDFELYIIGEGEDREALQRYIEQNNLSTCVFLLGFKQNPYKYMVSSDLLVCSSRAEGFSTVMAEAVILGLPIISTDCAGVRELFGNNSCGIITENNETAMYEALKGILANPKSLDLYRKEALSRSKHFLLEKSMAELDILFHQNKST